MKTKKILSLLTAATLSVSAFAGLATTANAAEGDTITPFPALTDNFETVNTDGETVTPSNIFGVTDYGTSEALTTTDLMDTALSGKNFIYASGLGVYGNVLGAGSKANPATVTLGEAKSLSAVDTAEIQFDALQCWHSSGVTATVSVLNSDNAELISYTYDMNACTLKNVKIGGTEVTNYTSGGAGTTVHSQSTNTSKGVNGFHHSSQKYQNNKNANAHVTFDISGSGAVSFKMAGTTKGSVAYDIKCSNLLADSVKKDIKTFKVSISKDGGDKAYVIDNLETNIITSSKLPATVKVNYVDEESNTLQESKYISGKYVGDAVTEEDLDKSDIDNVEIDGKTYKCTYKSISGELPNAVTASEEITLVYSKTQYRNVTVTNSIGGEKISGAEYTDFALDGTDYKATDAHTGYKLVDGNYYVPVSTASGDVIGKISAETTEFDIPFELVDRNENILLYEDFNNIAAWNDNVATSKNSSLAIENNIAKFIVHNQSTSSTSGAYVTKTLGSNISSAKALELSFDITVPETSSGRTAKLELLDSESAVILTLNHVYTNKNERDDGLSPSTKYLLYGAGVEGPKLNANKASINVIANFATGKMTVKADGTVVANNLDITAKNLAAIKVTQVYSNVTIGIDNLKVYSLESVTVDAKHVGSYTDESKGEATAYMAEFTPDIDYTNAKVAWTFNWSDTFTEVGKTKIVSQSFGPAAAKTPVSYGIVVAGKALQETDATVTATISETPAAE